MSSSVHLRRRCSRQGLERLLRLTTQWTVEDEEEAAQEQRRHERDQLLKAEDEDTRAQSPEPRQDTLLNLEPSEAPELDEDEGFGDWSQKPGQRGLLEVRGASQEDSLQENRALGPVQSSCGRAGSCHISTHLQPTYVMEALRPRAARPFLPRVWPASIPTEEGSSSQGQEQKDNHEAGHTEALLEGLNLNPGMEPQAGLDVEKTETQGMEEPAQDSQGPAGAGEAEEKPPQCQQGRTPSPLTLEGATEHSPPPLSPTTKLVDRTESLNRSINKSVKKSEPALPVSKIDVRLEQYTQAIEGASRTPKLARQPSIELPSMGVASTKSLWETGEVQAQSAAKGPSCKDIVAGDMSKRSLWEQRGGSKTSSTIKSTPSGKRYKFVATGHGKYEKVLMDEGAAP